MSTEQIMIQHSEKFSTGQLLQQGVSVQEKSIESLERQLRMIDESKQLATETLAELARQEEQLLKITDDVQTVRENLKYAGKQLRSIARRMAGDAAFRVCCIVMLVVVLVIIIIVAVVPSRQLNQIFHPSTTMAVTVIPAPTPPAK
jgi:t-SNARE complex subunit (syntaxin)